VALLGAVVLTCEAAKSVEDPMSEVRYRCDHNWGVEIYLQLFTNLRAPLAEDQSTVVDWRKTYAFEESDKNPMLRRSKPLRFDCVVEGTTLNVVFESYWEESHVVSVDAPGPRPTVTIASGGKTILKKTVLGLCPKGRTKWPKCPDDWSVRMAVSRPGDPLVLVQRLTSEFVE
jgi:hypothetical protein